MKKIFVTFPMVFLLCFTFSCQQGEEKAEETKVDIEAKNEALYTLREADKSWSQSAPDLEAFISFIADDVVWLFPHIPPMTGRKEVRAYFEPIFAMPGFSLTWTPEKVEVSDGGDMGYAYGYYRWTHQDSSNLLVEETRHYATFWRKQSSGEWKVVLEADY